MYNRVSEKRRMEEITDDEEVVGTLCRLSTVLSPKEKDDEKRMRREIANSNERRRMQSINAGFNSLKNLLPQQDGEKLSKAAILQQTADYVLNLQRENLKMKSQLTFFRSELKSSRQGSDGEASASENDSVSEETVMHTRNPMDRVGGLMTDLKDNSKTLMECRLGMDLKRKRKAEPYTHVSEDHSKKAWLTRPAKYLKTALTMQHRGIDVKDEQLTPAQTPEHTVEFKVDPLGLEVKDKSIQKSPLYVTSPTNVTYETPHNTMSTPTPTAIVTVLSAKDEGKNANGSIIEVSREDSSRAASNGSAEYLDDEQMVYIVNSGNNSQKSLATICEAIRHLEGDHMFPLEDQHSRLDEEVVAEETFGAEEDLHQSVPHKHTAPTEVRNYESRYHQASVVPPVYSSRSEHPLGGSMSNLTLQMVPSEPQEAPLELTTNRLRPACEMTAKTTETSSPEATRLLSPVMMPRQSVNGFSHSLNRPGVIVVKHS